MNRNACAENFIGTTINVFSVTFFFIITTFPLFFLNSSRAEFIPTSRLDFVPALGYFC